MRIIREKDTVTKEWSGGTTTELAICPEGAVYADRDFIWRLSTAVVRDEESTFTALPDYNRLLSLREGSLLMRHNGGDWYRMQVGDVSAFDGADRTESRGKVTDFNLMLRKEKAEGALCPVRIEDAGAETGLRNLIPEWRRPEDNELFGLYVSDGDGVTLEGAGGCTLAAGDLVLLDKTDDCGEWKLRAESGTLVIGLRIRCME